MLTVPTPIPSPDQQKIPSVIITKLLMSKGYPLFTLLVDKAGDNTHTLNTIPPESSNQIHAATNTLYRFVELSPKFGTEKEGYCAYNSPAGTIIHRADGRMQLAFEDNRKKSRRGGCNLG